MNTTTSFRCPHCHVAILNRRLPRCASCSAVLPPELLLSPEQRAFLDADLKRTEKIRADLARKAAEAKAKRAKKWQT